MQSDSLTMLKDLEINFNSDGWGPVTGGRLPIFEGVPYAHFDKKDRQVRPADFVSTNAPVQQRFQRRYDTATDFAYRHDVAEDQTFQLVDTAKSASKFKSVKRQVQKPQARNGGRGAGPGGRTGPGGYNAQNFTQNAKTRGKLGGQGFRGKRQDRRQDRNPSLAIDPEWELLQEFDHAQLLKLQANHPTASDLMTCGHVDQYDDMYERLTTKTATKLRRCENKLFYYVTSKEDPNLEKYAIDGLGNVFATDAILAQIMAAPRSVYSWDIVAQKVNGMIFLDKRDDSNFDLLTVSETAADPPITSEEVDEYNHPDKLSVEATLINQNFTQQILMDPSVGQRKSFEPNPFFDEDTGAANVEPASVAYVYRQFTMGNVRIVARCELHGWVDKRDSQPFFTSFALNEWDARYSGGVNWRQKVDGQKGAVLATEIKNNNCKIAKWTAQSILSNAALMKIGYVSRAAPNNSKEHQILSTQFVRPRELATQLGMSLVNVWGIVKMFCETLLDKPDGKYLLVKDPNKPAVRLYAVPINAFEEGEEEEEEEEGEEEVEEEEEEEAATPAATAATA